MRDSGDPPPFDVARTTLDLISALYAKQPRDHADLPMLCLGRNVPEDEPVAILRVDADGAVDPNVAWYCPHPARPATPLIALACPATG